MSQRARTSPRFTEVPAVVTFLVGPADDPTPCIIHKDFACHYSPVLKTALNSNFIEGQTQTYKLPDTTTSAFKYFSQFVYTQGLDVPSFKPKPKSDSQAQPDLNSPESLDLKDDGKSDLKTQTYQEITFLVQLWVLADKFLMPRLQNLALSAIVGITVEIRTWVVRDTRWVWEHTTSGCMLQQFYLDVLASEMYTSKKGWLDQDDKGEVFPKEFLVDLLIFMKSHGRRDRPIYSAEKYFAEEPEDQAHKN